MANYLYKLNTNPFFVFYLAECFFSQVYYLNRAWSEVNINNRQERPKDLIYYRSQVEAV